MKQVVQSLRTGATEVVDLPTPQVKSNQIQARTSRTLVSAGTERMLIDFGRSGWLDKARQQPDKVREVLDKVLTDGLATTIDAVRSKLDEPITLGYSNVGMIEEIGPGVNGFSPGDRVVSN